MYLLKSFVKNPEKTHYYGEDNDEQILFVFRASMLTIIPWVTLSALFAILPVFVVPALSSLHYNGTNLISGGFLFSFLLFWYLFSLGYFFQNFLNWYFNVHIVTSKKIVDMDFHGILYKNISETTLTNIEDVTSTVKGTIGIVFNIGDVIIQTAAENPEFEFSKVANPAKIRDLIADLVAVRRKDDPNRRNN
ncbi:hypothetical protein A3K34_04390 [candidate division WWE3 bacterium RIFOXYC1_FULL_40_10]|uniref:DUF304 domain-containing protein n=1 Tax=candidate division WWE3 bacterium RIFOXYA2_FULL_46_9 TaxID=1802636 RepID=A0A1F4W104_UNCKA|nr:MAG: hypothetical protein A3K58_04390 [candidate division WWE3 bacterium RIFOXYB1_FULL_40_22]OGC62081.1 MAG: hypothetical protein A3K37_04390 [candidate division WWE3 bacterium RIFOXYA1_FULL_40_11]OGC63096.1 MAG: hypothetical protein A2264_00135 [candidate division WWE3 bacterium RIFOXYA2_FULL_46_9]OGC64974.1 MAG: hypothetical protein A2326_02975 [candidate division WWE3 bacterium RIFOXYB2_FULL_41_6]OGC66464.1 MAG: hypothetical protein A3K34_04390 [candidate division WWE3 bacterium RIFOXYC1_